MRRVIYKKQMRIEEENTFKICKLSMKLWKLRPKVDNYESECFLILIECLRVFNTKSVE